MTQELIGELYRRYIGGELSLDDAAEQIFGLMQGAGLSVSTSDMDTAAQERTFALFGRLKWHALWEALPGVDIPPPGAQECLVDPDEFETGSDVE
jgi:hypothetical protein